MSKERKLNIFSVLQRFDMGDKTVYKSFEKNKDQLKELEGFVGFLALRWMSSAEDREDAKYCLEAVNEIANTGYFYLSKETQCKVLAVAGGKKKMRHSWILPPKKRKNALAKEAILLMYPHLKDDELDLWIELYGSESVIDVARSSGWQQDQLDKLREELEAKL